MATIDLNKISTEELRNKIKNARQAGYSDDEIIGYVGQNGGKANTTGASNDILQIQGAINNGNQTSQTPSTPQQNQVPQYAPVIDPSTNQPVNTAPAPAKPTGNLFTKSLPTIGGILGGVGGAFVPGLGETGVSEVGGAAAGQTGGKMLQNILEGRPANQNLGQEAVTGAIGGATGLGVGKLLGGVLGKVGEGLASKGLNLTKTMLNKLSGLNGEDVAQTLTKHNLAGADVNALGKGIQNLQGTFDSIAKSKTPVNQDIFLKNASDALTKLSNSSVPSKQALAKQVEQGLTNVGDKMATGDVSTMADLNAERQAFDEATKNAQFGTGEWGANRFIGDVLRKTLQQTADQAGVKGPAGQSLKDIGLNLSKLRNIQDLAQNREGVGESLFSLPNLLAENVGATLGGIPGAAAALVGKKALSSPLLTGLLSKGANQGADFLGSKGGLGLAGATGVLGGGSLSKLLFPPNDLNQPGEQKQGQNANNDSHTTNISQTTGGLLSDSSPLASQVKIPQNINLTPNSNVILQSPNTAAASRDPSTGKYYLKPVSEISNQVPGQTYTYDQYQKDTQGVQNYIRQNAGDPIALQSASELQRNYDTQWAANKTIADQYISTHQLDPSEKSFMDSAQTQNNNLNRLRDLIPKLGSDAQRILFQGQDAVAKYKGKTDPDFAEAAALMNTLRGQAVRAIEGGRPSNFDIALFNNMPAPGETKEVSLRKLEHAQEVLVNQYNAWAPMAGFTYNAPQNAQQIPSFLQRSPQQASPSQPPQENNFLINTLYGKTNPMFANP